MNIDKFRHRHSGRTGMWRQRQRLEWCCYESRNAWDYWRRKSQGGNALEISEGAWPCQPIDFRLLASRYVSDYLSIIFKTPSLWYFVDNPRKLSIWLRQLPLCLLGDRVKGWMSSLYMINPLQHSYKQIFCNQFYYNECQRSLDFSWTTKQAIPSAWEATEFKFSGKRIRAINSVWHKIILPLPWLRSFNTPPMHILPILFDT